MGLSSFHSFMNSNIASLYAGFSLMTWRDVFLLLPTSRDSSDSISSGLKFRNSGLGLKSAPGMQEYKWILLVYLLTWKNDKIQLCFSHSNLKSFICSFSVHLFTWIRNSVLSFHFLFLLKREKRKETKNTVQANKHLLYEKVQCVAKPHKLWLSNFSR